MNGTACLLFNLITENAGMPIVCWRWRLRNVLKEFSRKVESQHSVHLQNVLIML